MIGECTIRHPVMLKVKHISSISEIDCKSTCSLVYQTSNRMKLRSVQSLKEKLNALINCRTKICDFHRKSVHLVPGKC